MNADATRMPAEWEPHAATWLGWPVNESDWPGKLDAVQWAFVEIIRLLTPNEHVHLIVPDSAAEQTVRARLVRVHVDGSAVTFYIRQTNRNWLRDSGAVFVRNDSTRSLKALHFRFNAWAKYDDFQEDQSIPPLMAEAAGAPLEKIMLGDGADARWIVLEGGAIDTNGNGLLLAMEECLLDSSVQVRNPDLTREEIEQVLNTRLGSRNVLWLKKGIVGDDTHGHIDDVARFVSCRRVIVMTETNPADPNHATLRENREILESFRDADGGLEVIPIPMPAQIYDEGDRLPASYANFYIANNIVLVPTFNDPNDRIALSILQDLFPERTVCGIHAVDLVLGLGTLHCLTQQQPLA